MNISHIVSGLPHLAASVIGTKKAPPPIYLQIEPTSRCNLNCVMCFRDECPYELNMDMSLSFFKEIIDSFPLKYVYLTGYGEPFLNKDIIEMIDYAADAGASVEVTSNGTLLDRAMCEKVISSGLTRLNISLDGITTNKILRGVPATRILKAIEQISDLNTGGKLDVNINTVVLKDNEDDLINLVDALAPFPVTLNLKTNRPNKNYKKYRNDSAVLNAIHRAHAKGLKVNYLKYKYTPYCYRIYFAGNVNVNGELFVCCNLFKKVGYIMDGGWNSPEFQEFRGRFKKEFPDECLICNLPFNQKVHKVAGFLKRR